MKKLVITQLEIMIATPPAPYVSFCEEAWKKWVILKLKKVGFDLTKEFKQIDSIELGGVIFTQNE